MEFWQDLFAALLALDGGPDLLSVGFETTDKLLSVGAQNRCTRRWTVRRAVVGPKGGAGDLGNVVETWRGRLEEGRI